MAHPKSDRAYLSEMRDILLRMERQSAEDRKQAAEDRKQAAEDRKEAGIDRKRFAMVLLQVGTRIEQKLDEISETVQDTNRFLKTLLKNGGNGRSGNGQGGRR